MRKRQLLLVEMYPQVLMKINTTLKQPSISDRKQLQITEVSFEKEQKGEGIMLTLENTDILDCPICFEPLCPPVYQCDEGHLACDSCCNKITGCPTCTNPIGSKRCRAIENVVQSAKIPCDNKKHGCPEKLCYSKKIDHEQKECKYTPVSCPCCEYVGASECLYEHFVKEHSSSAKPISVNKALIVDADATRIVLQERGEKILFVLNRFIDPRGSLVNVTCIAPTSSEVKFSYLIRAKSGNSIITLKNFVEHTPKLIAHPPEKNCLLITKEFHRISVKIMKVS